jgi:hypothetical protein
LELRDAEMKILVEFALACVLVGGLGIGGACVGIILFNRITIGRPLP